MLLLIEFLDEFVFGAREAAWPLIRTDLGLSYAQVGLLLGLPNVIGNLVEPLLGLLGDAGQRRVLILGGGIVFTAALLLTALSAGFASLLLAFIVFYPASGAFVSLSQATLMDLDPARREQNMARWTLAGSLGVVAGPLALITATALGATWRDLLVILAAFATLILALTWRSFPSLHRSATCNLPSAIRTLPPLFRAALHALRRREVLRWLVLLEFADLMLDVLLAFLALYLVDVVQVPPAQAGLAVAVWSGGGLLGDLLLVPLLERVRGLDYLRWSALAELLLYPAFLLLPGFCSKLVLVGLLGLFNAGWYAIPKARLYASMPGQSGTALALNNVSGLVGGLIPLALGLLAQQFDLRLTMWLLLLGPLALLVGIPRTAGDGGQ